MLSKQLRSILMAHFFTPLMKSGHKSHIGVLTRFASYFFLITRKIKSEFSGDLEVTVLDGEKMLSTANANYSYGSLQKVLEFAIRQVDISKVEDVLVLGLGGGSVLKTLRKTFGYEWTIVSVEIDPVIIKIADQEFGVSEDYRTRIIWKDAFGYVVIDNEKFGLIIVDLFIDDKVPEKFLSLEFWKQVKAKADVNCSIIFNSINESRPTIASIKNELGWRFSVKEYTQIEEFNHLLIARSQ